MPRISNDGKRKLDALLEEYPKDLPGTVIGVINREGDLLYLSSTGPRHVGEEVKAQPDDVSLAYQKLLERQD